MELESFRKVGEIRAICIALLEKPFDLKTLSKLKDSIDGAPKSFVRGAQKPLITCFMPYFADNVRNSEKFTDRVRQSLVEALKALLDKLSIGRLSLFFNFYTFLLLELYDYKEHKLLPVAEEYKLAVLQCTISLVRSLESEKFDELYVRKNVPQLSQMIYVCSEIAKSNVARNVRCAAINCILALANSTDEDDFTDTTIREKCADVFMFFLPGLSKRLTEIALENSKIGHLLPAEALKAYNRLIVLVMQSYGAADEELPNIPGLALAKHPVLNLKSNESKERIDEFLQANERSGQWYKMTDEKLNLTFQKLASLTHHEHPRVRKELTNLAVNLTKYCYGTMPVSVCTLIEYLVVLSQDVDDAIASESRDALDELSVKLENSALVVDLLDHLKDGFYNAIGSLPRRFNGIDDADKAATISLLIGYVKLFGRHEMYDVLLASNMLSNLLDGLLHVTELEKSKISLLEEYTLKDLSSDDGTLKRPWLNFVHFRDDAVQAKLETLCAELVNSGDRCFELVCDSLTTVVLYESGRKKEALFLLNSVIVSGGLSSSMAVFKSLLKLYTDDPLNDLATSLDAARLRTDRIQENVLLICLLTEGVARLSVAMKEQFRPFLLHTLYLILEKAGCQHPLVCASGLFALRHVTGACGYGDVAELLNDNFRFFAHHVRRKLVKLEDKQAVLSVLSVVFRYSNPEVLLPMKDIVEEVLLLSCDKFKQQFSTDYLRVFKMFVQTLRRWFSIEPTKPTEEFKSRRQKDEEQEHFRVTGIEDCKEDYSTEQSAEEMFREDYRKMEEEEEEEETSDQVAAEKPAPPLQVALTSLILKRSLHFLPSKNRERQLLVLEILESGVEILRDWDDELLPVVHQIWSPLIQRFGLDEDPLVLRLSIRLVATLARLSKDFIRMRVVKELLPKIKEILKKYADLSRLKDKGAAYRYSQAYKMQLEVLSSLGPMLYDLDVVESTIEDMICAVSTYLSDKQPQELQSASVNFIKNLAAFDLETVRKCVDKLRTELGEDFTRNIERLPK